MYIRKYLIIAILLSIFPISNLSFAAPTNQELQQRIDYLAQIIENLQQFPANNTSSATTIGGYGELHFNNKLGDGKNNEIDFHRFIILIGHKFTDKINFFSELELEHSIAGDGKSGEIELEQAYIEFQLNDNLRSKLGLFLVPIGIINETHEPTVFYGIERNLVEKNIIPATWWESGIAINTNFDNGLSLDLALHSGLNTYNTTSKTTEFNLRSGRQKSSVALANSGATTGRIKYNGIQGLELSASLQQQTDISQGQGSKTAATLDTYHLIYNLSYFTFKALYARWDINNEDAKNSDANKQIGYYVETAYRINPKVGVFVRSSRWDQNAGNSKTQSAQMQNTLGVNYWAHEQVVIKADYIDHRYADKTKNNQTLDSINLGVGYNF